MSVITASQTASIPTTNGARLGVKMSNDLLVALAATSTSYGMPHYWTSADGITWTDRGALPSIGTSGPDTTNVPSGMDYNRIGHVSVQVIGGQEKLCLFFLPTSDDSHWVSSGQPTVAYYEAWYDGSNTFTSARGGYLPGLYGAGAGSGDLAAYYDGTIWYQAVTFNDVLTVRAGTTGSWKPVFGPMANTFFSGVCSNPDVVATGGTILALVSDASRNQLSLIPCAVSGTTVTAGTIENAGGTASSLAALALDNSGNCDILFADSGLHLVYRKRTGLATYTPISPPIDSISATDTAPALIRDSISGDLWVIYGNSSSQANGEIKYARLHSGSWGTVGLVAGGDASGYQHPKVWGASATGVNVTYLVGTSSTRSLEYAILSAGVAPGKPTGLTTGNVVGTTPDVSYTYVNSLSNDPQGWRQVQVSPDAGSTIPYDSGQVATASTAVNLPSGAGLSYGTLAYWRVRDWDALSANGTGTVGPWSDWTAITPVRGGTVTLTDIYSAGATSSSVIAAPSHQDDIGWAQADSHDADMLQEIIYADDGTTPLFTSAQVTISPVLAAGGTLRAPLVPWSALLTDGISVKVKILLRDAATLLWSSSSLYAYTVTYAPPPTPTGLTFTPNSDQGFGTLAWTNDGVAVSAEVQMQDVTGTWVEASSGTLIDTIDLHPACGIPYAYRVRIVDSTGMVSLWATLTNEILLGQGDLDLSWWFNDTLTGDAIAFGMVDTSSNLGLTQNKDKRTFNPPGQPLPKTSFGTVVYLAGDLAFQIMPNILSGGTVIDPDTVVRALEAMCARGFTCLSREPNGTVTYMKLDNFRREPSDDLLYRRVQFSVTQDFTPKVPFL